MQTIFSKIINREIPADIVYEDNECIAFKDINPQAPIHILVVPKTYLQNLSDTSIQHKDALFGVMLGIKAVADKLNLHQQGYRVVINNGESVGQSVFHLHAHVPSGREFAWPPG